MADGKSGSIWQDIKGCYLQGQEEMSGVVRGE